MNPDSNKEVLLMDEVLPCWNEDFPFVLMDDGISFCLNGHGNVIIRRLCSTRDHYI